MGYSPTLGRWLHTDSLGEALFSKSYDPPQDGVGTPGEPGAMSRTEVAAAARARKVAAENFGALVPDLVEERSRLLRSAPACKASAARRIDEDDC